MELIESDLIAELGGLTVDPSPSARARIMSGVRAWQPPRRSAVPRWRSALAMLGAAAVLVAGSVDVVASSQDAYPSSPTYKVRLLSEQVRLGLASPDQRVRFQIGFASTRTSQARQALGLHDQADARDLLRDSRQYLASARQDLGNVGKDQQGQVQSQLNQAQADEQQTEGQLNQQGEQG